MVLSAMQGGMQGMVAGSKKLKGRDETMCHREGFSRSTEVELRP